MLVKGVHDIYTGRRTGRHRKHFTRRTTHNEYQLLAF